MIKNHAKQHGRSMLEMLAVLAIIGVLSITALVGFTYAMNKHRANETIYDVMLRGTNVPMIDENYYSKPSGYEFHFAGLGDGTYYSMVTKKDSGRSYYVEATGVSYRVCEQILKMEPTDIDQIVVNNSVYQGDSDICGSTDGLAMRFCFGSDGAICNGTGTSGGTSSGSGTGSGSGSGSGVTDPCEGIVASSDCGISEDVKDENGCVLIRKINCSSGQYCLGQRCEPCPAADSCSGESCCALTGPDDVCGNPTKTLGTISTVTHSDLNSNGCCESTTEESCSLNPVTPRTCTPTCEGTCQSDGTCRPNCAAGESYNEIAGQCCTDLTETDCQKLILATSGVCPSLDILSTEGLPCTTIDGQVGTCKSGMCTIKKQTCGSDQIVCPPSWECVRDVCYKSSDVYCGVSFRDYQNFFCYAFMPDGIGYEESCGYASEMVDCFEDVETWKEVDIYTYNDLVEYVVPAVIEFRKYNPPEDY